MFKLKKIDKLIAKKFFPNFITAFSIALFVLIMQVLWLYIDEIVGKGVGMFMILEMIFYKSVAMVPRALPLGVLVASVMVLGGMGENYELASMKSAGMSLWRIMRPMMIIAIIVSMFSFVTSNTFIPMAQLKFQSRMYDIQKQQPVFSLDEGIFNNKFDNKTIYVKKKGQDKESIFGVKIYENENNPKAKLSLVTAEKGKMYSVNNGEYMVLKLENGTRYDEEKLNDDAKFPFKITKFKSWQTIFDMRKFNMVPIDEKLWKTHYKTLNISQLSLQIDSIDIKMAMSESNYLRDLNNGIGFRSNEILDTQSDAKERKKISKSKIIEKNTSSKRRYLTQVDSLINKEMPFLDKFPIIKHKNIKSKAVSLAKNALAIKKRERENNKLQTNRRNKYIYTMHSKIGSAVICLVFLFIGAPLGAIVRKGGFGFPILISILFFMLYFIINVFFQKTMETGVVGPELAVWYPVILMSLLGMIITFAAVANFKLVLPNFSNLFNFIKRK